MFIPDRIEESNEEDIQSTVEDIETLTAKYIIPIDRIRSISRPRPVFSNVADDGFTDLQVDNTRKLESRVHAFYRFIGFPVATKEKFYNPGFNPIRTSKNKKDIDSKFNSSSLKTIINYRETNPDELRNVFVRQDISSSVYSILLREIRPIQILNEDRGPFDKDAQSFEVAGRRLAAEDFFSRNPNIDRSFVEEIFSRTIIGPNFTGGRHVLRPFVVDPRIDNTVMPDSSRVAVPFLPDKDSLKIDQNTYVLRPGIELIIRERLRDAANQDANFFQNITILANNESQPSSDPKILNESILRLTAEALLDENNISSSTIAELSGITTIQVRTITYLVKTIKSVVKMLHKNILIIDKAMDEINWVPIPSTEGPEQGVRGALLNKTKVSNADGLDKKIFELKIKKLNIETRRVEEADVGSFASPFEASTNSDDFDKVNSELQQLIQRRDKIAGDAFKALGEIEIISGEVSGLGLIDILAIYTALWAMDEKALIDLLDEESFTRLVTNFKNLAVGAAEERLTNQTAPNIESALDKFEKKLINIFSFIQREIGKQLASPGEDISGTISPDG